MVVRELRNLFSFLTVLPVKMDNSMLSDCARYMFIFPLIGAFIGLVAGAFGWLVSFVLPGIVVGGLVTAVLLWLTGLHHTDGLLDFGDGVMVHGTAERKIEVMHDQLTGAGGLSLGILTMLITALAIGQIDAGILFPAIIVIEVSAKFSMVVMARAGKAVHEGMNTSFLSFMHGSHGTARLLLGLLISLAIALPLLHWVGALVILAGVLTSLVMTFIAHRNFNGVTGDVFGATNELARLGSLIALLVVISWMV
ncbi:MAG: adenosylcobinamide-GDP ribazoletransferase [Candidatus Bathyarchaeota archaeon]|nr:adenosylcobinamide-GDP ribazoletransferase [Candidatus Termiticorpusculum sp.]MCL1971254.1 adenosylcobinamide-GDP ribazoletransferase [Candidatus Termiticorpusculum sp.]